MAFQAEVELENSQRAPIPVVSSLKYGLLEDGESKLFIEMNRTPEAKSKYDVKPDPDILIRKRGRVVSRRPSPLLWIS